MFFSGLVGRKKMHWKREKRKKKGVFVVETQSQSQSSSISEPECFEDNAWLKEETLSWHVARRCININVVFSQNACALCPPRDKLKLKDISITLMLLFILVKTHIKGFNYILHM